jgi:hypothetical protein
MTKNKTFTVTMVNEVATLNINNQPAHCPFRNPFFMPPAIHGAAPQMSIPACNDFCPFFNYNGFELTLNCTETHLTVYPDATR